jgi:hypothetical protein
MQLAADSPGGAHQVVKEQGRNYHIARFAKHGAPQIQFLFSHRLNTTHYLAEIERIHENLNRKKETGNFK